MVEIQEAGDQEGYQHVIQKVGRWAGWLGNKNMEIAKLLIYKDDGTIWQVELLFSQNGSYKLITEGQ